VVTRFAQALPVFLARWWCAYCTLILGYMQKPRWKVFIYVYEEDTDIERSTQEAIDAILEGMDGWVLVWDDGPYYQLNVLRAI